MAKFKIISKDGKTVRYSGCPRYSGSYMGVSVLEFSEISSPVPIAWEIGDYVDYRNGRYYLYSLPEPKKQARRGEHGAAFVYNGVQFHSAAKELEIALFRDVVADDNEVHFSTMPDVHTYEDVYGIARRIEACINDLYPGRWRVAVHQSNDEQLNATLSEVKEFSLSGGTCLDALSLIYDTWQNVGWIYTVENGKNVVIIARANVRDNSNTTPTFRYGKGAGLTAIKRASANKEEFATRLYVYGSERNLPPRYYNSKNIKGAESVHIPNLMLPIETWGTTDGLPDPRLAYIEAEEGIVGKYGLIPRVVRFDGSEREEIYPSIEGLVAKDVRKAMIEGGYADSVYLPAEEDIRIDEVVNAFIPDNGYVVNPDGTSKKEGEVETTFTLEICTVGFDMNQQAKLANEKSAVIAMKSGPCAGREFPVKKAEWSGDTWILTMERQMDDSLNMLFPNYDYLVMPGDSFVLLDIAMPEYYVVLAQKRMLAEGEKLLADYTRTSAYYEPQIDARVLHGIGVIIREGMYMRVVDEDIVETEDNSDYVLIDTLAIDEQTEIPTYSVTLREQKRAARGLLALEEMIEDAKERTAKELSAERSTIQRRFSSALNTIDMLQGAVENFTEGINPATVRTMAMLVGDQSLQFRFTTLTGTNILDELPVKYEHSVFSVLETCWLWHMTLGIDSVTALSGRSDEDYLKWSMPAWSSDVLEDGGKGYYLYARVPKNSTEGRYILSEDVISMESESGYYHLLVGILNREYEGTREFVHLYGFTEVLPGQISTDLIKSADGKTYFDLAGNVLNVGEKAGMSGTDALLRMWAGATFANRASAPFRVNDDGHLIAENATIRGEIHAEEGKIGPLAISEYGIAIAEWPKGISNEDVFGIISLHKDQIAFSAMRKDSSTSATSIRSFLINLSSKSVDTPAVLINSQKVAIKCPTGTFDGLRTKTRVITTPKTAASPNVLDEFDFSVLINATSGSYYISLPSSPLDGQEYWLETFGADVIMSSSVRMWSHTKGAYETTHTFASRGVVRFKYYADASTWTYSWVESL